MIVEVPNFGALSILLWRIDHPTLVVSTRIGGAMWWCIRVLPSTWSSRPLQPAQAQLNRTPEVCWLTPLSVVMEAVICHVSLSSLVCATDAVGSWGSSEPQYRASIHSCFCVGWPRYGPVEWCGDSARAHNDSV